MSVDSVQEAMRAQPGIEAPVIVFSGTPGDSWRPLAEAAVQRLGGVGYRAEVLEHVALEARAATDDAARFVVFVEPPERVLASRLPASGDASAVLDGWALAARQLLRLSRQRPGRWRLFDALEAACAPQALADEFGPWKVLPPPAAFADLPGVEADALALQLCERLVAQRPALRRLHEELHASCVPLPSERPVAPAPEPAVLLDGYRQLTRRGLSLGIELDRARAELTAAQEEMRLLTGQLHVTQEALETGHAEIEASAQQAKALGADLATERTLHAGTRDSLKVLADERQALQRRLDEAADKLKAQEAAADELRSARQSLEVRCSGLTAEIAGERKRHAELQLSAASQADAHQALRRELDAALARLAAHGVELERAHGEVQSRLQAATTLQASLQALQARHDALAAELARERQQHAASRTELQAQAQSLAAALDAERQQHAASRADLQAQATTLVASRTELQAQAQSLAAALDAERQQHVASRTELQEQAQSLAAALDAERQQHVASRSELQTRADALAAELVAEREQGASLQAGLQAQADARQTAERQLQAAQAANATLAREREAGALAATRNREAAAAATAQLQRQLEGAQREHQLVLRHLHDVQEQLESQCLRTIECDREREMRSKEVAPGVRADAVVLTGTLQRPPHCHADFELRGVHLGPRQLDHLPVRLVEHGAQPGLLFWPLAGGHPIMAWHADGAEDGRDFMLLVPHNPQARQRLLRLGSMDWQLVLCTARLLQRHLAAEGLADSRWLTAASRLCRQLEDLPARLRYDAAGAEFSAADRALQIRLDGASFGARTLGTLQLRWEPGRRSLQWLAPVDPARALLSSWPVDAEGRLQPSLDLPVGAPMDAAQRRRRWAETPQADRDLMLALLDALPGAALQADAAALPGELSPRALASQAAALHKQARRSLAGLRAREFARRLLRRTVAP